MTRDRLARAEKSFAIGPDAAANLPPQARLSPVRNEIGLLLASIREAGHSHLAALFTYRPRDQTLLLAQVDPASPAPAVTHPASTECILTRALHTSLSTNLASCTGFVCSTCKSEFEVSTATALPVGIGATPLGVVALFGQEGDLSKSEAASARRSARIIGSFLRQSDRWHVARELAAGFRLLHRASTRLHSALEPGRLYQLVLDEAGHLVDYDWGAVYIWSPPGGPLRIRATRGVASSSKPRMEETALARSPGTVLRSGRVIIGQHELFGRSNSLFASIDARRSDAQTTVCLPLVSQEESLGVLELGRAATRTFTHVDLELLQAFAEHAGTAVANARAHEQIRSLSESKRRELANMSRIGQAIQAIGTSLEIDTVLNNIVRGAAEPFQHAGGSIALLDRERRDLYFAASTDLHVTPLGARLSMHASASGWVVQQRRPLFVPSLAEAPSETVRTRLRGERLKSFVGVPLVIRNTAIGSLNVYSRTGYAFEWSDVEMLQALASQAATAIEHASLYASVASQKAQLEALVGSLHEGLLFVNHEGLATFANRRLSEFLETMVHDRPATPASTVWHLLVVRSSVPSETRMQISAFLADPSTTVLVSLTTPRRRDLEIRCFTVEPGNSSPPGRGYLFRDVTHQSEVERLKSSILATVSHELRTPLAGIKGFATSLLRTDVEWDEVSKRDFLTQIDHETDRLTALVRNLLDMSRLDTGGIRLDLEWCDLCEVTAEVLSQAAFLVEDREIDYSTHAETMPILMDRRYIERVIWNLLDNAAKYSPPRTVITVSIIRDDEYIGLSVRDQGVGVRPEEKELVFERFYRGVDGRRKAAGTGLGLAICKGIVEAHQGSISVESGEGDATTFTVWLPAHIGSRDRESTREA